MDSIVPSLTSSPATLSLMVLTVLATLAAFSSQWLWRQMALAPYEMVRTSQYHAVFTSGLIHADLMHLFFNMLALFFFGPALEMIVGGSIFVVIYLVSLVVGNLFPLIKFRNKPDYLAIGASGAVSGVLFSFCLFNPLMTIYFFFIPMPAFVFAILYMLYSIYGMRVRRDNIGHEAHLAGALAGVITTLIAVPEAIDSVLGLFA